ncbi:MAG TPA: HAMP domain-containing sensor histidine kinase, partial [Rhodoblastus sp.]|nr:HAMP domain-containing sensor histidine kinase [Rhodoblastus sp.]
GSTSLAPVVAGLRAAFPALAIHESGDLAAVVRMSSENLRIILMHLADNAARHGARRLDIEVAREADVMRVWVRDDGTGVSANNRDKIFDSFFTTRRDSGGTGMGLAIVRAMLVAHGGGIELRPTPSGAEFLLILAAAGPGAA